MLNGAVLAALGLAFQHFGVLEAWYHYNPALTWAGVLCDDESRLGWTKIICALFATIFSLGGYFVGHLIAWGIFPGDLSSAASLTSQTFGRDFVVSVFGLLLITHVYLFSSREFRGVWGVIGICVAEAALIAIFTPANGGSFNFWRTLAVGALEGNLSNSGWGPKFFATIFVPIVTCFLKFVLLPMRAGSKKH
jgi:hypothetical protein